MLLIYTLPDGFHKSYNPFVKSVGCD